MRIHRRLLAAALVACVGAVGRAGAAPVQAPSVTLSWSMPARYELGRLEWQRLGRYTAAYVRPAGWTASFDLCRTTPGVQVTRYDLTVVGVGFDYRAVADDRRCHKTLRALPRLGAYEVTAAAESRSGVGPAVTRRIELRDYLIVSLGDSFASGEGSPDRNGSYDVTIPSTADYALGAEVTTRERRPPAWQDVRCHRSARSAHALFAKAIEDADAHSSVTFVSLACSGADVGKGLLGPYAGAQPPAGSGPLPAQVDVLGGLVGSPGRPGRAGPRRIDALLLQIGLNDLGFSDILHACATELNLTSRCFPDAAFDAGLARLRDEYRRVASTLSQRFPGAEVYTADYPGDVFAGGGCGALGRLGVGITASEGSAIAAGGRRLTAEIRRAAVDAGWNYVGGLTELFSPHAYCSSNPWFTTFEQSYAQQGNDQGTAHPNPDGYRAFAAKLGEAVVVDHETRPAYEVRLVIEKARVGTEVDPGRSPSCALRVALRGDGLLTPVKTFDLPVSGRLVEPAGGPIVFDLPIYRAPQPGRRLTAVSFGVSSAGRLPGSGCMKAAVRYGPAAAYGRGVHTFETKNGSAELRYRIEVTRPGPAVTR